MVCYASRKYNYYNSPLPSLVGKFVNSITIVHSNVMTQIPCTIFLASRENMMWMIYSGPDPDSDPGARPLCHENFPSNL